MLETIISLTYIFTDEDETFDLVLPLYGSTDFTYSTDWGDGKTDTLEHAYSGKGTYTVVVTLTGGTYDRFGGPYGDFAGQPNLVSINYWGPDFTNLAGACLFAKNLASVPNYLPTGVTDLSYMFYGASIFDQPIDLWNTSSVINMSNMFYGATTFNQDIGGWDISGVQNMSYMLDDCGITNYDAVLTGWASQTVQPSVSLGASGLYYSSAGKDAWFVLTEKFNWTITGDTFSEIQGYFPALNYKRAIDTFDAYPTICDISKSAGSYPELNLKTLLKVRKDNRILGDRSAALESGYICDSFQIPEDSFGELQNRVNEAFLTTIASCKHGDTLEIDLYFNLQFPAQTIGVSAYPGPNNLYRYKLIYNIKDPA